MDDEKKSPKWRNKLAYLIFFFLVYLFFVYALFPYQKIKSFLEVAAGDMISGDVSIDKLHFGIFSGVRLDGINIKKSIKGADTDILQVDELIIKPNFASLLTDNVKLRIESNLYGGRINASANLLRKPQIKLVNIDFIIYNIDISRSQALKSAFGVTVNGTLNGSLSLVDISKGIMISTGEANMKISGCEASGIVLDNIGSGIFKIEDLKLPDLAFKEIGISLKKEQRIVRIDGINARGNDANVFVSGNINLNSNIKMSSGNIGLKFSLSPEYLKQNETLTLFDENFMGFKDGEGFYNIKIEGQFSNPKIRNL